MRPHLALFNKIDELKRYIVHIRYFSLDNSLCEKFANLNNLFLCQLGIGMRPSARDYVPAFFKHVGHVVLLCSQKEMRGADALGIVTLVTHEKIAGAFSISHLVNNAIDESLLVPRNGHNRAPSVMKGSGPFNAMFIVFDLAKNALKHGYRVWSMFSHDHLYADQVGAQ